MATYILVGAGVLIIGAFFISRIDRPTYDGTYCATAWWSKKAGFHIDYWKQQTDLVNIPKGAARVCYKDSIQENGWAQIEIETQRIYPDWVQAYAAGILEGSLTWNQVYNQWLNTINAACERDDETRQFCLWLRELLIKIYERIKHIAEIKSQHDHYWHQIGLYYHQLEGLETGYRIGAKRARSDFEEEIPFADFLIMNAAADMHDLSIFYENFFHAHNDGGGGGSGGSSSNNTNKTNAPPKDFQLPSATMLMKLLRKEQSSSAWQLLFGHSTAGSYASMLRIQKRYKFHYHFNPNQHSKSIPGLDITFTGYPGIFASTDDFYIVKGRQLQAIVAGVTIKNRNLNLWQTVNIADSIPMAARVMAANRLSQSRRTWVKTMSRQPFTGCKQWLTVDLNKLESRSNSFQSGTIWISEQLPGHLLAKDVTEKFLSSNNGTSSVWLANGTPYLSETLQLSGVNDEAYLEDLKESQNTALTSLESVDKYLRRHGFRGDLLNEEEAIAYGNIDIKLFLYNSDSGMAEYHAIAGPLFMRIKHLASKSAAAPATEESESKVIDKTAVGRRLPEERFAILIDNDVNLSELKIVFERRPVRSDMKAIAKSQESQPPFKWSSVGNKIAFIEHVGHPDEWNFHRVSPKWAW